MKLSKTSFVLLFALTAFTGSGLYAQQWLPLDPSTQGERAKLVMRDNELVVRGESRGTFYNNPLLLDSQPLNYNTFTLKSKGDLMLIKGSQATNSPMAIPFYIHLRRNGKMVELPKERELNLKFIKLDLSAILEFALPDDELIIEPANNEDWEAKRILKLLDTGC